MGRNERPGSGRERSGQVRGLLEAGAQAEAGGDFAGAERLYRRGRAFVLERPATSGPDDSAAATLWFRLARLRYWAGALDESRTLLGQMRERFTNQAQVSVADYPVPGTHMSWGAREIADLFEREFLRAPLHLSVAPLKPNFSAPESLGFRMTLTNVSREPQIVALHANPDGGWLPAVTVYFWLGENMGLHNRGSAAYTPRERRLRPGERAEATVFAQMLGTGLEPYVGRVRVDASAQARCRAGQSGTSWRGNLRAVAAVTRRPDH
jgi:hypothetical protein